MTTPVDPYPRSLSAREADTLRFLLSVDDDRLEPLRAQAATAYVTGTCGCGCATIHLAVDRERTPAAVDLCGMVASADARPVEGDLGSGLLLFLDDGWLSLLEIWWIDVPPPEFPPVPAFEPPRFACDDQR